MALRCQSAQGKRIAPVRASAAVEAKYYAALHALLERMHNEVIRDLAKAYTKAEPQIAQDASPLAALVKIMDGLTKKWRKRFEDDAETIAQRFTKSAQGHAQRGFQGELKRQGFIVQFKPTRRVQDVLQRSIAENVNLITGMSADYLKGIETAVNMSVMNGRDLKSLGDTLQQQYGVSRRRASLIARDQNSKATSAINRTRQLELGITEAIWVHSSGGKHPRPSHVKAGRDKLRYRLDKGAFIDDEWIHPGECINCFTGETLVNLDNGCHKVWRHDYRGDVLILEFGETSVRATPNHPLLTSKGWVAAELIEGGDYVWEARLKIIETGMSNHHIRHARFDDLFDAFGTFAYRKTDVGSGFDFHGHVPDSEVETVGPEVKLSDERYASLTESVRELLLANSDSRGAVVLDSIEAAHSFDAGRKRDGRKFFGATVGEANDISLATAPRIQTKVTHSGADKISGTTEVVSHSEDRHTIGVPLDDFLVVSRERNISFMVPDIIEGATDHLLTASDPRSDIGHTHSFIVKPDDLLNINVDAAMRLSALSKVGRKPSFAEMLAEFISVYADVLGESFECGEFVYRRRRISDKFRREYYSGHVYTLESDTGYYTVGETATATKNCRCVSSPIIPGFDD